jgi:rhamnogalacturonan endolyase
MGSKCYNQMFLISAHYSGDGLVPYIGAGEAWKKVSEPVFMYFNSVMDGDDPLSIWEDAKLQVIFIVSKMRLTPQLYQ